MHCPRHWHLFCKVIDNYGDIGVCWRLARQLAGEHGLAVTLWVDDLISFGRLCPALNSNAARQVVDGVQVNQWCEPLTDFSVGEVVIEAFGCHLPANYIAAMAETRPRWLNLEYLSAEAWVRDYHLNHSPVAGLQKTFFFPGFFPDTGGLLWDQPLLDLAESARAGNPREHYLQSLGLRADRAELLISLFAYENAALPDLLDSLTKAGQWVTLLVPEGRISAGCTHWLGQTLVAGQHYRRERLTLCPLPFMAQPAYDEVLALCDLNFVRGEESFVRSQMLARPLVWHIYPQEEGAHLTKLEAFLDAYLAEAPAALAEALHAAHRTWNQPDAAPSRVFDRLLKLLPEAAEHAGRWQRQQRANGDLASNIVHFCTNQV